MSTRRKMMLSKSSRYLTRYQGEEDGVEAAAARASASASAFPSKPSCPGTQTVSASCVPRPGRQGVTRHSYSNTSASSTEDCEEAMGLRPTASPTLWLSRRTRSYTARSRAGRERTSRRPSLRVSASASKTVEMGCPTVRPVRTAAPLR